MFTCNELCIYELLIHKSSGINVKHMCAIMNGWSHNFLKNSCRFLLFDFTAFFKLRFSDDAGLTSNKCFWDEYISLGVWCFSKKFSRFGGVSRNSCLAEWRSISGSEHRRLVHDPRLPCGSSCSWRWCFSSNSAVRFPATILNNPYDKNASRS